MRKPLSILAALASVTLLVCANSASAATIPASGDTSQPSAPPTNHSITGPGGGGMAGSVFINEDVEQVLNAGPWHKNLINNTAGGSGQIFSGSNVSINETMANLGSVAWTQWTEQVVTRTTINTPNDSPGFQFRNNTPIQVQADYGSGFVTLTNGVQYILTGTPAVGPGFDPQGYESLNIAIQPGFEIQPGDSLRIIKNIFEVFLDGNVWMPGEAAELAQFPGEVPEPASASLCGLAALALLRRRAR